ncbi:hypothetical protein [Aureimonas leprariae]|uniref:Uncharacterized protein n=1 Tax=Plantimonas leprariae TaxID=2615207 RepID=A0A7V7PRU6_9HYPH|nr:hypothetical protein [Aureimonas leprariae]KAB0681495.1 hypothetical protein F6X38_06335 [Aureimonas leprariae]
MGYAAYHATDDDLLDLAVDEATRGAGGDLHAAILRLVRRQHHAETEVEPTAPPAESDRAA